MKHVPVTIQRNIPYKNTQISRFPDPEFTGGVVGWVSDPLDLSGKWVTIVHLYATSVKNTSECVAGG